MRRYEVPLRAIAHYRKQGEDLSTPLIATARKLYDGMTDEELLEPVPIDNPSEAFGNYEFSARVYFERILGIDYEERKKHVDFEAEAQNFTKNYDVVISQVDETGEVDEPIRLMWFLAKHHAVTDTSDQDLLAEFEELSTSIEQTAELAPGKTKEQAVTEIWSALRNEGQ